jgi:hypothetical protein
MCVLKLKKTDEKLPYLQIEKKLESVSLSEAKKELSKLNMRIPSMEIKLF